MKRFLFLVLLFSSLTIVNLAQTPSPSPSVAASGQSSPTAQAEATQDKPVPTSVKISTSGLELSGFPIWIIWVLLGVAVVGVLIWFFLGSSKTGPEWPSYIISVIVLLCIIGFLFSIGSWWGRRSARSELQELIAVRGAAIEVPAPQTFPSPQTSTSGVSQPSWPLHIVIMGFVLLLGLEVVMYFYVYLRWRWNDPRFYGDRYDRYDRYEGWRSFTSRRFDAMEEQLADLRSRVSKLPLS